MYAYINADRDVIGFSAVDVSVADFQTQSPTATARIDGAPDSLQVFGALPDGGYQFHRLLEGQGGQVLADYELVDWLDGVKAARDAEVNARTAALIAGGFAHGGFQYPLDEYSREDILWTLACTANPDMDDLVVFPATRRDLAGALHTFADMTAITPWWHAAAERLRLVIVGGKDLRAAIAAAGTKAALDAVVDERT